jgi:hypothetical protein
MKIIRVSLEKKTLIIIISTLIFSLYFSESYLIINKNFINSKLKEFDKKKELFIKTKKIWDNRSKIEIYNDLKYYNDKVVVEVPPGHYLYRDLTYISDVGYLKFINHSL